MSKYEVLQILVEQAELVRGGSALDEGKLSRFRTAIEMKSSSEVAQWVESSLEQALFHSLEDVQRMEEQYIEGSRSDLAVQCCIILELALHCTYIVDEDMMRLRRSSFFDHCRTLTEIAHLRFRLDFLGPRSLVRHNVEFSMQDAVTACARISAPTWLDMLLSFKMTDHDGLFSLLHCFAEFLWDGSPEIPTLPATLLLSFVCEALRDHGCSVGERVAGWLLKLGASPMVSAGDHHWLFKKIHEVFFTGECRPWWLDARKPEPKTPREDTTAMRRQLYRPRSQELWLALNQKACCYLDARRACQKYLPPKVPRLQCIAARQIRQSDVALLPRCLMFEVSKHLALPVDRSHK